MRKGVNVKSLLQSDTLYSSRENRVLNSGVEDFYRGRRRGSFRRPNLIKFYLLRQFLLRNLRNIFPKLWKFFSTFRKFCQGFLLPLQIFSLNFFQFDDKSQSSQKIC